MADTAMTRTRGQWYFIHVMAVLTIVTTVIYWRLYSQFDLTTFDPLNPPPISPNLARFAILGTIATFWFWIRMMAANLRERPSHHAAWTWFMVIGFMFGALPYFVVVWRPAHRPD